MTAMHSKGSLVSILIGVAVGTALACIALSSAHQPSFMLVTSRPLTMARTVAIAPMAMAPSAAQNFVDEAEQRADGMAMDDGMAAAAPPSSLSWGTLAVAGLIPTAILAAAAALVTRKASQLPSPVVVDLETGGTTAVQMGQSPIFASSGRPSMALGAKKGIHPEMYESPVYCGGELVMTTNGTKKEYVTDIWSGNHPFYQKGSVTVSTTGRIEKFKDKYAKFGGLGKIADVPVSTGPAVMLKLEPKAKKKAGKK